MRLVVQREVCRGAGREEGFQGGAKRVAEIDAGLVVRKRASEGRERTG